MNPLQFLKEELESIKRALHETLRHDYGPRRSSEYFKECRLRLEQIEFEVAATPQMGAATIAAHMQALGDLGSRISLIERSHLGESSWPFAETIHSIANKLFREHDTEGYHPPIMHVIAEGVGYHIVNELEPHGERRIVVVAFPRQLKHHVLLHTIFGHELGHIAQQSSNDLGLLLTGAVTEALRSVGPMRSTDAATKWLHREDAPNSVKAAIASEAAFVFGSESLRNWTIEIICDLVGLLLFGPPFAAAHRTLIEPLNSSPFDFDLTTSTHPPYPIRQRIIGEAVETLGWHEPVLGGAGRELATAETAFLQYVAPVRTDDWSKLLTAPQLKKVLSQLKRALAPYTDVLFSRPESATLERLVRRLVLARPPIIESLDGDGVATNEPAPASQALYAGWVYWFGRDILKRSDGKLAKGREGLSFLETNRLCDYGLLQQCAIDLVARSRT